MPSHKLVAICIDGLPQDKHSFFHQFNRSVQTLACHYIPVLYFPLLWPGAAVLPATRVSDGSFASHFVTLFDGWYGRHRASFDPDCRFIVGGYSAGGHLLYRWCESTTWPIEQEICFAFTLAAPREIAADAIRIQRLDGSLRSKPLSVQDISVDEQLVATRLGGRLHVVYGLQDPTILESYARFDPALVQQGLCTEHPVPRAEHYNIGEFPIIDSLMQTAISSCTRTHGQEV